MKSAGLALSLALTLSVCAPSMIRAENIPPPPPADVPVPQAIQDTPEWCWLAVVEMVMHTRMARPPNQCALAEDWMGLPAGSCCADLAVCSRFAIDLHEVEAVLEHNGMRSRYSMPILPNALYSHLRDGRPVIAQVRRGNGSHAVVVRGMRFERDHARAAGWQPIVIVNDPMYGLEEYEYEEFTHGWMDALIVEP